VELEAFELLSILLSALVLGVFWGPWVGLTRSIHTFTPVVFLAIAQRLNLNLAPLMTVLMPASLLSILPVLYLSYKSLPITFYLSLSALALFLVALLVTVLVEVPISKLTLIWTTATLPEDWPKRRDRWGAFHIVRIVSAFVGMALLVAGIVFEQK
jgi:hypothetical protein